MMELTFNFRSLDLYSQPSSHLSKQKRCLPFLFIVLNSHMHSLQKGVLPAYQILYRFPPISLAR